MDTLLSDNNVVNENYQPYWSLGRGSISILPVEGYSPMIPPPTDAITLRSIGQASGAGWRVENNSPRE
jgi:hypothetical protein